MICDKDAKIKFCTEHREHLNRFEGMDYSREILRLMKGNICEGCKKEWKLGMRRFDIHHGQLCGQRSRKYDRVADVLQYKVFCHRCHFNQPDHTLKKKVYSSEVASNC